MERENILPDRQRMDELIVCLAEIKNNMEVELRRLQKIMAELDCNKGVCKSEDAVEEGVITPSHCIFVFMEDVIAGLRSLGKIRTSETYSATLSSFKRFRNGKDLELARINSDLMLEYEAYLRRKGVSANSSSFYMRNLRAVYNRAVERNLVEQRFPFKHVYTGVDKTLKRAIPISAIRKIKEIDLCGNPSLDFARDMFLFSFYTRGMSFVDMAYLRKRDLNGGMLSYRRQKTGQQLVVRWEKCMQEIVNKYNIGDSAYLLPIIDTDSSVDIRRQYLYKAHAVNRNIKRVGLMLNLPVKLTMYVARHTWASIAKSKNVPLSVISESMGHDSEATTRIYLASLDNVAIDKANRMILKSL